MQQYPLEKQHWEMNAVERAEVVFKDDVEKLKAKLNDNDNDGKPLTAAEKDKITRELNTRLEDIKTKGWILSQVNRLNDFRVKGSDVMEERDRYWEKHLSNRLGDNLRRVGKMRPDKNCQAHAIIAGTDPEAGYMRSMLAVIGKRVDDPCNGAWLPSYEKYIPHWSMPNSVCHAWLNNNGYHRWISTDRFTNQVVMDTELAHHDIVLSELKNIATLLQNYRDLVPKKAIVTKKDTEDKNQKK